MALAALLLAAVPASAAAAAETTAAADETSPVDAAPEAVSPAERAAAIAEPAIVVIEVRWDGYVRDRETGEIIEPEPVSAATTCSGVGVGGRGYLLTTGSCVEPTAVARDAFAEVVDRRVRDGRIRQDQAPGLLAELLSQATIGSPGDAEPAERSVLVRRAVTDDEPMPASVVAVADPSDGDAALLRIERNNQPILPLAAGVSVNQPLVILECPPAADAGATTGPAAPPAGSGDLPPVHPRFRTGVVAEVEPHVLVQPSLPPLDHMAGGVVLTQDAAIVGLVRSNVANHDLVVDSSVIRELLDKAEVDTELGQVDRDFRAGLDAYYGGDYTESIERFDSVLAIIPAHVQAHEFRDEAQALREEHGGDEPPRPSFWDRFWDRLDRHSGGLVGLGVLVAIIVFLVRRRPPHPPAAGDRPAEDVRPEVVAPRSSDRE